MPLSARPLTSTVIAQTTTKTAQLTYKNIKVNINGVETPLTDLSGNVQEPCIAFDTVYVPLSATARAFGKVSTYDGNSATVNISDRTETNNSGFTTIKLSDLDCSGRDWVKEKEAHVNNDSFFQDNFIFDVGFGVVPRDPVLEVFLNGQYAKFEATLFLGWNERNIDDCVSRLKIWGDGKLLYTSSELTKGLQPTKFSVNVNGINALKIGFDTIERHSGWGHFCMSGATLQKYK